LAWVSCVVLCVWVSGVFQVQIVLRHWETNRQMKAEERIGGW